MRWIQSDLPIEVCEEQPDISFRRGWTSLEVYLRLHHRVNIDADAAPSSLYDAVTKLGDTFKPPLVTTVMKRLKVVNSERSELKYYLPTRAKCWNNYDKQLQTEPKLGDDDHPN
jgi:hypothetical protein